MKRMIVGALALGLGACAQTTGNALPVTLGGGGPLYPLLSADIARVMCPPAGWSRDELIAAKAAGFEIADNEKRQAFARAITACLASPDPAQFHDFALSLVAMHAVSSASHVGLAHDLGAGPGVVGLCDYLPVAVLAHRSLPIAPLASIPDAPGAPAPEAR